MGSLPNLRSLSNDPNTIYTYELCDPEYDISSKPNFDRRFLKYNKRQGGPFNSQHEIRNVKIINHSVPAGDPTAFNKIQHHYHHYHHHHHKVRHTRSSGSQYNYHMQNPNLNWDDYLMQLQASTYSPISSRSSRSNVTWTANNTLCNFNHGSARRRDSLSSSGGASSVRRLIAVVRSTPSRLGPVYSRKVLCKNFAALCLGHVTVTAALLPLISLQSSISTWWWPHNSLVQSSDIGSLLFSGCFAIASIFTLFSPSIIHILGCNWTLVCGYICTSAFFIAHLYPTIRSLIPAYILLGLCMGPISCARTSYLVTLANKLTYVMTEDEEIEEQINGEVKGVIVQKLSRGLQASQDLGMVLGNVISWCFLYYSQNLEHEKSVLKNFFYENENRERICGSQSNPFFESKLSYYEILGNSTWYDGLVVSCRTTAMMASVFIGCGVVAVALTAAFTDRIQLFLYQDPLERPHGVAVYQAIKNAFRNTRLQLAAPMSIFIGLQQGFIHADFSKWYVVCSLGVSNVSLVFLSMGLLQSIAAFTLSLLLQNVPRYLVIVTGFVFHSCLLLVLLMWKPSGDDSALFYVIAAAWGVCGIIWEILNFNLLLHISPDSSCQIAFVHGNFFKFIGLAVAFGLHGILSTWIKLYALAFFMVIGITPHTWLEMKLDPKRRVKSTLTNL